MEQKIKIILLFFFISNLSVAQIGGNLYELNPVDNLLTDEVKKIVSNNMTEKRIVFLEESGHHIGSDFLAKSEFIKYLVCTKLFNN